MTTESLIPAWNEARDQLGIRVIAPFPMAGKWHDTVAILIPDFGGNLGTLIRSTEPPDYHTDAAFMADLSSQGFYVSFLNIDVYRTFHRGIYIQTLVDWGYTGPPETVPMWVAGAT